MRCRMASRPRDLGHDRGWLGGANIHLPRCFPIRTGRRQGDFGGGSQAHLTDPKRETMLQEDFTDFLLDILFRIGSRILFFYFSSLLSQIFSLSLRLVSSSHHDNGLLARL